jgi:hypothetical protein
MVGYERNMCLGITKHVNASSQDEKMTGQSAKGQTEEKEFIAVLLLLATFKTIGPFNIFCGHTFS